MDIRKIAVLMGGYDVGAGINTYYPLDEGGGIHVEDFSQYDNHGILKNGPIWGIVDGVVGLTFDGSNDYIEDSKGRHIVKEGTTGFWSEVKIGDKTKIVGTGTKFYFSSVGDNLEGQFVTDFADYCTSLTYFYCNSNSFSGELPSFAACTALTNFYCYTNAFSGTLPSFAACTALTDFSCHTNAFSGTLPSFATCTALSYFRCYTNAFSGTLPSFAACTALNFFYCYTNAFSGTLPSFATCTALSYFRCNTNAFSGYEAGGFATQISLTTLDISTNAITAAADINAILTDLRTSYDLVGRVACTVKLEGGTNAAPTGQGITDKDFLNNHGWTVTTN
jgi:hypothetical protein